MNALSNGSTFNTDGAKITKATKIFSHSTFVVIYGTLYHLNFVCHNPPIQYTAWLGMYSHTCVVERPNITWVMPLPYFPISAARTILV